MYCMEGDRERAILLFCSYWMTKDQSESINLLMHFFILEEDCVKKLKIIFR